MKPALAKAIEKIANSDYLHADKLAEQYDKERWYSYIGRLKSELNADIGKRYWDSTIENYETNGHKQKAVLARVENIAAKLPEFIRGHYGLIFYGGFGTGKDHLIIGLLKRVAAAGYSARWLQASELYDQMAEHRMDSGGYGQIMRDVTQADVVCLSDPIMDRNWTEAKASYLAAIVRKRYDLARPTWITTNVADINAPAVRKAFFPDVYDRLIDRAALVHFDWPSYRKSEF